MTFKMRGFMLTIAAGTVLAAGAGASGQIFKLQDRNSTANFNIGAQSGQNGWNVDGIDHMFQQWFWYRAGNDGSEHSIDTLVPLASQITDTNHFIDPRPDTLDAVWMDSASRFDLELTVQLRGGTAGSNRSDLGEQIFIFNKTNAPLPFTFFQYVDLDLNNTITDLSVQILNGERAEQIDGIFGVSETVVTPLPSRYEANFFSTTRDSLNDNAVTNLNNNAGLLGPGDLTWAFQWNFVIPAGGSVLISKDKSLIPAPGAATVLALGGLVLARRRRR